MPGGGVEIGGVVGEVAGAALAAGGATGGAATGGFGDGTGVVFDGLVAGGARFRSAGDSLTVSGTPAAGLDAAAAGVVTDSCDGRETTFPRLSAARPTATHAMSATPTQALPGRLAKRCCASQRKSFAPARQPAAPISSSASRLNRTASSPLPVTVAWIASTA